MASFTKEVNERLAKRPLVINGRLANRRLTSLVKEAHALWSREHPRKHSSELVSGTDKRLLHNLTWQHCQLSGVSWILLTLIMVDHCQLALLRAQLRYEAENVLLCVSIIVHEVAVSCRQVILKDTCVRWFRHGLPCPKETCFDRLSRQKTILCVCVCGGGWWGVEGIWSSLRPCFQTAWGVRLWSTPIIERSFSSYPIIYKYIFVMIT